MNQTYTYELFADFHQFILQDEAVLADLSESWTEEAVERMLAVAPGVVGVGTARDMDVPVVVEVRESAPDQTTDEWDQVTEYSLEASSGRIVVAGCTDHLPEAARIEVRPGWYRVRVYYHGLDSLSDDGLTGEDHYRVVLWPASPGPVTVIKQRANRGA